MQNTESMRQMEQDQSGRFFYGWVIVFAGLFLSLIMYGVIDAFAIMFKPIAEEFQRSSILLYRGSSAVLYALLHGVKPIYVDLPGSPDIDPLFELTSWREHVASVSDLVQGLQRYAASDPHEALAQWRSAGAYAQAYVKPVDGAAIDELLEAVGLSGPLVEAR